MLRARWPIIAAFGVLMLSASVLMMRTDWWSGPPESGYRRLGARAAERALLEAEVGIDADEPAEGLSGRPDVSDRIDVPSTVHRCRGGEPRLPASFAMIPAEQGLFANRATVTVLGARSSRMRVDSLGRTRVQAPEGFRYVEVSLAIVNRGPDPLYVNAVVGLGAGDGYAYSGMRPRAVDTLTVVHPRSDATSATSAGVVIFVIPSDVVDRPMSVVVDPVLYVPEGIDAAARRGACVSVQASPAADVGDHPDVTNRKRSDAGR